MFSPFHTETAASRSERKQLDHLLWITAPHERIMLASVGMVLAAFILWGVFGSIPRSVTLDGILLRPGLRYEVTALEPGHLLEFQVAHGDHITPGEPIARQTVPELERELSVLQRRIDELRQTDSQDAAARSLLDSAHVALLQLEANRAARSLVVSHSGGEVMNLHVTPGDYVSAGTVIAQLRAGAARTPRAVLHVTPDTARHIKPGMSTDVGITMPDGTISRVPGKVISLTVGPYPLWLAALLHVPAGYGHRVDVELDQTSDLSAPDGAPCRIRIELGESAPIDILTSGRS